MHPTKRMHRTPHVILICIDALRYDCMNWQPETPYFQHFNLRRQLRTPTLDAIAAQSLRFGRAVSHAGYTPLSLATTLTGTYARTHGVVDFQNTTCPPNVRALGEFFKQMGYRTASACGPDWFTTLGLTRDVDRVHHDERVVLEMLREDRETPLFSFVHFNDVHSPYGHSYWDHPSVDNRDFALFMWTFFGLRFDESTREFIDNDGRRAPFERWDQIVSTPCSEEQKRDRLLAMFRCYLHGIEKFDQTRLRLFVEELKALGEWDDAIVCVFADHGEIIAPRMPWVLGHGKFLLEQLQRVPLMIKAPGIAPRDVKPLVGLVDIAPTLLDLAGGARMLADVGYELDGASLRPAIERDEAVRSAYYQEGWSVVVAQERSMPVLHQRAMRTQRDRKLMLTGQVLVPDEYEALTEDEYLRYLLERGLGEIAHPQSREELRRHLRGGLTRRQLATTIERNVPRAQLFDVAADPFERTPLTACPDVENDEFGGSAAIDRLVGVPSYRETERYSAAQEQVVLAHLASLGYVDA